MDEPHKSSARDFFLYFLAIGTLYITLWRFIDLLFEYINVSFPDQLEFYYQGSFSDIRLDISALLIVFPVYLGLTWFLRKDAIAHPEKRELRVRKWLLNFTLFLAAVTIIADLVTLVNNFLNGDLTVRFGLKVLVVLLVAGSVFGYYLWDLRRTTAPDSKPSKSLAILATIVVLGSIVSGFFIVGSPASQRLRRFDDQRVNNLQTLQSEIINYWMNKKTLPASLNNLKNDITGFAPPVDPETQKPYEYGVAAPLQFELCANFSLPSQDNGQYGKPIPVSPYPYGNNWSHESGRSCFTRTIDPALYSPNMPVPLKGEPIR